MKKLKSILGTALALFVTLSLLTGCGGDPAGTATSSPTDAPQIGSPSGTGGDSEQLGYWPGSGAPDGIVEGSSITVASTFDYASHVPYLAVTSTGLYINLYDSLFYVYQGNYDDIRGALVESWEMAEDGLSIVMQVRQGVTFTNGNPLNAQTIIDSYKTTAKFQPSYFANISNMEATGEYELTFTFVNPYPDFFVKFAHPAVGVADPAAIAEYGAESNQAGIGTGPYYIESYVAGSEIVLKANPNYAIKEKQPHIETVKISVIPNGQTAAAALMTGEVDFIKTSDVNILYTIQDSGMFEDCIIYPYMPQPFYLNMRNNEMLQNPAVREAIAKMIDWQSICDLIYDGYAEPLTSVFTENTSGWVDGTAYYYYNPEEALSILANAGINPADIKLEFKYNQLNAAVATALQEQLRQSGVDLTLTMVDIAASAGFMASGEWDIMNSHGGYTDGDTLRPFAMGLIQSAPQKMVHIDACDPELYTQMLDLYDAASTASSDEEMLNYCHQIIQLYMENYICIGGFQSYEFELHANNIRNIVLNSQSGYCEFCYWYIED